MARRLLLAVLVSLLTFVEPASAADGEAPAVATATITPTSAASVSVSVEVDTHNAETVVKVEYVTAGAYRMVPSAATTVTLVTVPASAAGPATATGHLTGLDPGTTYRMRVKASNVGGETTSTDVNVSTPKAPKIVFRAKVGKKTTTLTKLVVTGLVGSGPETVKIRCKTVAKGCPFSSVTSAISGHVDGWTKGFKGHALQPGAKVILTVLAAGSKVAGLTLTIRDDQQPKVKRT